MAEEPQQSPSRSPYIVGGAAVVAVGVALFLFLGKSADEATCALTTTGIVTISEGLTKGHSTASIMAKGGLAGTVPGACKSVVASLVEEPEAETEFQFVSPEGEIEESASGFELAEPSPPPEPSGNSELVVDCILSYGRSEFLYRMCLDGVLTPTH